MKPGWKAPAQQALALWVEYVLFPHTHPEDLSRATCNRKTGGKVDFMALRMLEVVWLDFIGYLLLYKIMWRSLWGHQQSKQWGNSKNHQPCHQKFILAKPLLVALVFAQAAPEADKEDTWTKVLNWGKPTQTLVEMKRCSSILLPRAVAANII